MAKPCCNFFFLLGNKKITGSEAKVDEPKLDEEGYAWQIFEWTAKLSREQKGAKVKCAIQSSSAEVEVNVRCKYD